MEELSERDELLNQVDRSFPRMTRAERELVAEMIMAERREHQRPPRYIVVQLGTFADGEATPSCQIYERNGDWTQTYYLPAKGISDFPGIEDNHPCSMGKAQEKLEVLQRWGEA